MANFFISKPACDVGPDDPSMEEDEAVEDGSRLRDLLEVYLEMGRHLLKVQTRVVRLALLKRSL